MQLNKNFIFVGAFVLVVALVAIAVFLAKPRTEPSASPESSFPASGSPASPEGIATQREKSALISLSEQNGSGENGIAFMLESGDGNVQVDLSVSGAPQGVTAQPAHIHLGSCANLGAVKYPLTAVTADSSSTVLEVSFDKLMSELPLAINVHKSATEAGVYVACGDIFSVTP